MPIMGKYFRRSLSRRFHRGYTLIEMCIAIAILGFVLAGFMPAYTIYKKDQSMKLTANNLTQVSSSLYSFFKLHGYYPCPASLTEPPESLNYGMATDCEDTSVGINSCAGGICVQRSERTDVILDGVPENPLRVRRGGLPFKALNIPEEYAYDGYGSRIVYALTEILADPVNYQNENGGISVIDELSNPVINSTKSAYYLLISPGANRKGAYSELGTMREPCTGAGLDVINCSTTAPLPPAIYRAAPQMATFDDFVRYNAIGEAPLWVPTDNTGQNIRAVLDPLNGLIAVSQSSPDTSLKADIGGTAIGETGTHSTQYCKSTDGTGCFSSDKIAGDGMKCPNPGQVLRKIAGGGFECIDKAASVMGCPPNMRPTGINTDRTVKCTLTGPPCPSIDVQICTGTTKQATSTLPVGSYLQTAVVTAGDSKIDHYLCVDGAWAYQYDEGVCECIEGTNTQNLNCGGYYNNDPSSWPLLGTMTVQTTTACPSGNQNSSVLPGSSCGCPGAGWTNDWDDPCGSGFSGVIKYRQAFSCSGSGQSITFSWGSWPGTPDASECACLPNGTETQYLDCPGGIPGQIKQQRSFTCTSYPNGASWGSWNTVSNTCSCTGLTETISADCPGYTTGTATQKRKQICTSLTSGYWSDWVTDTSACKPMTCYWHDVVSGSPGSRSARQADTVCAPCGTSNSCYRDLGGYVEEYPKCDCIPQQ